MIHRGVCSQVEAFDSGSIHSFVFLNIEGLGVNVGCELLFLLI